MYILCEYVLFIGLFSCHSQSADIFSNAREVGKMLNFTVVGFGSNFKVNADV